MTTDVVTVGPDARVVEVAETLLASRISAVPVIGERGELVGIVSEGDLMRRSEARTERRRAWWLEAFGGRTTLANDYVQANAQKVADVMTRNVVTATPDTPLCEIAALLERHHIETGARRKEWEGRGNCQSRQPNPGIGEHSKENFNCHGIGGLGHP